MRPNFGSPSDDRAAASPFAGVGGGPSAASSRLALHVGPPPTAAGDETNASDAGSGAQSPHQREAEESAADAADGQRCPKCGFRKNLAPFCPRDGSRHLFASYSQGYRDPNSYVNINFDSSFKTLMGQSKRSNALMENRPLNSDDIRQLGLPPGRNPDGTPVFAASGAAQSFSPPPPPPPHAAPPPPPGQLTSALRSSLNMDPRSYEHSSLYTRTGAPLNARKPFVEDSDYRAMSDYIRETKIAVQKTNAISAAPAPSPLSIHSSLFSADSYVRGGGAPTGAASSGGGKWGQLFDYNDVTNGSLGVLGGQSDGVFGVYREDAVPQVPSSRMYINEQRTMPSVHYVVQQPNQSQAQPPPPPPAPAPPHHQHR